MTSAIRMTSIDSQKEGKEEGLVINIRGTFIVEGFKVHEASFIRKGSIHQETKFRIRVETA